MTALYVLRFGDRALRLLLADDAWRRLGIAKTEWNGHLAALVEALADHGNLKRAAEAEYLGSPLGPGSTSRWCAGLKGGFRESA